MSVPTVIATLAQGIARALISLDEKHHPALRKVGLLTRAPRIKERKKPGLKPAQGAPIHEALAPVAVGPAWPPKYSWS
jgi:hypothetical protein